MSAGLVVENLRVELLDGTAVVDDVSLTVARGEVVALVGESGCGKTTIGVALLGSARRGARIASGRVLVGDVDILAMDARALRAARGRKIAYVPQDPSSALSPGRRLGWQLREALRERSTSSSPQEQVEAIKRALDEVGLPSDSEFLQRFPHQLSGGQLQRIILALAFLLEPEVIVFDEPTTSLDVTTQAKVLGIIRRMCRLRGVAAIYVTHDLAVVRNIASRVLVLYAGRVVEAGVQREVFESPTHPYSSALLNAVPDISGRRVLARLPGMAPRPRERDPGCAFAPRCIHVKKRCVSEVPTLVGVSDNREVACWAPLSLGLGATTTEVSLRPTKSLVASRILEVSDLSVRYGQVDVVANIQFDLRAGECLALVGQSGSGKSTIARAIVGLAAQCTGTIRYEGRELASKAERRERNVQREIQYIFQNPDRALNPRRRVLDTIIAPIKHFFDIPSEEAVDRAMEALRRVSLPPSLATQRPRDLSGGERQRVAIARAIACEPRVLICDEVTSALDVSVQASILDLLGDLQAERNLAFLFVTHNLAVVRQIADRVAVLGDRRLVEIGEADRVIAHPSDQYTQELVQASLSLVPTVTSEGVVHD